MGEQVLDISSILWLDVDQFYGIEYDEFAAKIAEVAMWLIDHQMNMRVSEEFGQYFARLPLKKSAKIVHGNSLRINWDNIIHGSYFDMTADEINLNIVEDKTPHYETITIKAKKVNIIDEKEFDEKQQKHRIKFDYIIGNPPFIGSKLLDATQRADMANIFSKIKNGKILDYVSAWYFKAAQYIHGTNTKAAFVSTNSVTQGEQVSVLWGEMINKLEVKIHFAHTTFKWSNEAKGKAAVYCIIVQISKASPLKF